MAVHVKALTYAPKIPGVLSGEIRQTIRPFSQKKPVKPGDVLLLHGWFGLPYRSPWSWRLRLRIISTQLIKWDPWEEWFFPLGPFDIDKKRILKVKSMLLKDGFPRLSAGIDFFRKNYPKGQLLQVIIWDWPPIKDGGE